MPVFQLSHRLEFPPVYLSREDGLLAVGGDLSSKRLLLAYRMGIFPWYNWDEPVLWWSPDPRLVLFPSDLKISRSLKKLMRQGRFNVTMDLAFSDVITACANIRLDQNEGTWIGRKMIAAYCRLHDEGFAHSVEAWAGDRLIGGLYGVSIGSAFFGESMFSYESNASKVAFASLCGYLIKRDFSMIDCQVKTKHLVSFGAKEITRSDFLAHLAQSQEKPTFKGIWHYDSELSGKDNILP